MKKAQIHYFSGTGNTDHMVRLIGGMLADQGYAVVFRNMEMPATAEAGDGGLHLFSYPVYGFGTPSIVLRYLNKLPPSLNGKAAVLCSCAGMEGRSLVHASSILRRKGFDVFLTDIAVYPQNWTQIAPPCDSRSQALQFAHTDAALVDLSRKIATLTPGQKPCSGLTRTWSWVVSLLFRCIGRRVLGKTFIADETCNGCRSCVLSCPVGAIRMSAGKPRWNWQCENCGRCMNLCPRHAVQTSVPRLLLFVIAEIAVLPVPIMLYQHDLLPAWIGVGLYLLLALTATVMADALMALLERHAWLRRLFARSFTQGYRRYRAADFQPPRNH